jgi:hypothetical protein
MQQQSEDKVGDPSSPGPGLGQGHPFLDHAVAAAQEAAAAAVAHQHQGGGTGGMEGDPPPLSPPPHPAPARVGSALASHPIVSVPTPTVSPTGSHPKQESPSPISIGQLFAGCTSDPRCQAGSPMQATPPVASTPVSGSGRLPPSPPRVSPFLQASQTPLDLSRQSPPTSPTSLAVQGKQGPTLIGSCARACHQWATCADEATNACGPQPQHTLMSGQALCLSFLYRQRKHKRQTRLPDDPPIQPTSPFKPAVLCKGPKGTC